MGSVKGIGGAFVDRLKDQRRGRQQASSKDGERPLTVSAFSEDRMLGHVAFS